MSRTGTAERLGRLLAIVPWVAAHDGPTVQEVCRRFNVSERELVSDLELLFLCGVYPFTPDTLIEVDVSDGRVWIRFADWFSRPLRLTPPEGLALVSAASAFLAVPGADREGPLAAALAKLETVLGSGSDDAIEVELGDAAPDVLDTVQRAASQRRKLRIVYYSFGRDGRSTRVVHPWRLFSAQGAWYLSAWCELVSDERLFRVDRIQSAEGLDERFEAPAVAPAPEVFHARPQDPLVVMELQPAARWVAERYPAESIESRPDGRLRVQLRVSERAWLERLLLRAGPDATVVEGAPGVAAAAARRVMARYRQVSSTE